MLLLLNNFMQCTEYNCYTKQVKNTDSCCKGMVTLSWLEREPFLAEKHGRRAGEIYICFI